MDGTDPESEALIWQLHRELNGLTRSSRRGAPSTFMSLQNPARSDTRKDKTKESRLRRTAAATEPSGEPGESNKRRIGSPEDSSQRGSKKKKADYNDDAGSKDVTTKPAPSATHTKSEPTPFSRGSAGNRKPVAKATVSQADESKRPAAKPQLSKEDKHGAVQGSKARSGNSDGPNTAKPAKPQSSNKPSGAAPAHEAPPPEKDIKPPPALMSEPEPAAPQPTSKPHVPALPDLVKMEQLIKTHSKQQSEGTHPWQAPSGSHHPNSQPHSQPQDGAQPRDGAAGMGSPLAAAAAAAASLVKDRARAGQLPPSDGGGRTLKCFHAGVRWGIALKSQDIQSRADLAQKLNDAFAGEILSCGRGDALHVIFVDSEGAVTEFPSLRSTHVKESQARWQAMVEKAVKIYVRRS